jgi:hypothetical protein
MLRTREKGITLKHNDLSYRCWQWDSVPSRTDSCFGQRQCCMVCIQLCKNVYLPVEFYYEMELRLVKWDVQHSGVTQVGHGPGID